MKTSKQASLDDYAKKTIFHKARRLAGKHGFKKADLEDLMQELALDLWERLPKYDPGKGAFATFVTRLIERKISNLIRHRCQAIRDFRREAGSLNEIHEEPLGDLGELSRSLGQEDLDRHKGVETRPEAERMDLRLDISMALAGLPPHLKALAKLLSAHSISEAARLLGVPRSTLYQKGIAPLRAIFKEKGLEAYL